MRKEIENILSKEFERFVSENNFVIGYEMEDFDEMEYSEYTKLNNIRYDVGFEVKEEKLETMDIIIKLQNFINNLSDLIVVEVVIEQIIDGLLHYCSDEIYCDFYIKFK